MTDREVMKQAWNALELAHRTSYSENNSSFFAETITALRAQLEQPDRQTLQAAGTHPAPCARHCETKAYEIEIRSLKSALRTAVQRKPLTHEQAKALVAKYGDDPLNLVFQTEAAHGIGETT